MHDGFVTGVAASCPSRPTSSGTAPRPASLSHAARQVVAGLEGGLRSDRDGAAHAGGAGGPPRRRPAAPAAPFFELWYRTLDDRTSGLPAATRPSHDRRRHRRQSDRLGATVPTDAGEQALSGHRI